MAERDPLKNDGERFAGETMKYAIYLFWISTYGRSAPLRRILAEVSRPQRWFLLILVAGIVGGQLYEKKARTYPFVKWGMYADIDHKGKIYAYSGVRPDGSEFRLPMTDVVRTHSKRFIWRLRALAGEMRDAETVAPRHRGLGGPL